VPEIRHECQRCGTIAACRGSLALKALGVPVFTVSAYWQYANGMSTLFEDWPEPDRESVARRLRMHMGDKRLNRKRLAMAAGLGRSALSAKLDGESEFTISEILLVAHAINRSWVWVLTGYEPAPPDDGSRLGESNSRPIHYRTQTARRSVHTSCQLLRRAS
jgi:transcriptional regulator with XRE-family HTH domain